MSRVPEVTRASKVCQQCHVRTTLAKRPVKSRSHKRGRVGSFADHDLCRQCWESARAKLSPKRARGRMDGVLDDLMAANAVAPKQGIG